MRPETADRTGARTRLAGTAYRGAVLCLLLLVLGAAVRFREPGTVQSAAVEIREPEILVSGVKTEQVLPGSLSGLAPRTAVTVRFSVGPEQGDTLFLHPVYSPLRVYADGELLYVFGEAGRYPRFFTDPPTGAFSVPLPVTGEARTVRLEYRSPAARNSLFLYPPVAGTGADILYYLAGRYGRSLLMAVFFALLGLVLLVSSLLFLRFERRGKLLRYPGALAFSAGVWQWAENTLSVYLTRLPSLLYLLAFMGLFTLVIPVYRQAMLILSLGNSRLLRGFLALMEASVLCALLFQFTGILPFSRSMYWFHILLPLALCVLAGRILYEAAVTRNAFAVGFFLALVSIAAGAVLELVNYYFRFSLISTPFQWGLLAFILICALLSVGFMNRIFAATQKNLELQSELAVLKRSIDAQKEKNTLLLEHEEEVRRQRHDLRQHLNLIRAALDEGRYAELQTYVGNLTARIPVNRDTLWCDHPVANALLSHYVSAAESAGVSCTVRAQIPAELPHVTDGDLCVLMGNLLENAVEACGRMKSGPRQIAFRARVQGDLLALTVDNSYDGKVRLRGGQYYSSKRDAPGMGLRSVETVAKRCGGGASFESGGTVFRASVYVRIE